MTVEPRLEKPVPAALEARPVSETEGFSKTYARTRYVALSGVHATIHKREFASVIGPSGDGRGFGALVRHSASKLDTPRVFPLILYPSRLGLALFFVEAWMQLRFVFWNKSARTGWIG